VPARCAFLDNDRILVRPGPAAGIEVRDAKTGKLRKAVSIDGQRLWAFELSADRKWVAVVTRPDPTTTPLPPGPEVDVAVLDTVAWKVRGTIGGSRRLLALAADGRNVLVRHDGQVEVWDVVERKMLRAAPFEFKWIDAAALSPDGSVAAVSGLNEIAYWKWRDGGGDHYERLKTGRKVDALVFSPDGKLVAEGPDTRLPVEVRDVATLKVAQSLSDPAQPRVPLAVGGITFADSGKTLVCGNGGGLIETIPVPHRIHFWDVPSGKLTLQIDLKGGFPSSLDVSPDGKALAAVTADGGVSLRVWDLSPADGTAPRR
jgi:WD40 repeat protein